MNFHFRKENLDKLVKKSGKLNMLLNISIKIIFEIEIFKSFFMMIND